MSDIHNVFMPHRHEDDARVAALKRLLESKGVVIRDASITSDKLNKAHDPGYIKNSILKPGIQWAGKIIVLITPDTKNHEWVNWEINLAAKLGKAIIGVWDLGSAGCELPEALDKYADAVVGWNGDRIVEALDGARTFYNSDGSKRGPQPVSRIDC